MNLIKAVAFKIKRLFKRKTYVNLDGVCLNSTYTNRYFKNGFNEGRLMSETLKTHDITPEVIIDAGANYGDISLYMAKEYPEALILAIEPSTANVRVFKDNLKNQNFNVDGIMLIKKALTDRVGKTQITKVLGGQNRIINLKGRIETVETCSLENIVRQYDLKKIDFLKIDIEGSEYLLYDSLKKLLPIIKSIVIETADKKIIDLLNSNMTRVKYFTEDLFYVRLSRTN